MPIYNDKPCNHPPRFDTPVLYSPIGINPKITKAIDASTKDWLDKHPEATTTVEDDSITNVKLKDKSVNTRTIDNNAITTNQIANGAVTAPKIANDAVTTPKIANGAVTAPKIAASAADGLRTMSATQPGVAKVGAGLAVNNGALELSGGSIAPAVTAWLNAHPEATTTVQDGAITTAKLSNGAVTDAKLAQKGGVLESIDQITSKMQITGHNWCSGVSADYMDLDGRIWVNSSYVHTDMIPVSTGDIVKTYSLLDGVFSSRSQRFVTAFDENGNAISDNGAENSYNYIVPVGVASVVISVNVATNYMVTKNYLATEYEPYDVHYVATEDFITKVKTESIDGFSATGSFVNSDNIFSEEWFYSLGYVQISQQGKLIIYSNDNYRTYIMPASGNTYDFTSVRFALKLAADKSTPIGNVIQNVTTIDSDGASWVAFSFNTATYPASAYVVTERLRVYTMPINWQLPDASKQSYGQTSGSIAAGGSMRVVEYSCIKDGYQVMFKGFLTSFTSIRLNFIGYSGVVTNYIDVSTTELTIKNNNNTPTTFTHGLTIANDISLLVEFINGEVKVTLESSGLSYTQTVAWYQTAATVCYPQIVSDQTVLSDAKLTISYSAAARSVWYFGDSYISFGDNVRWPYYLVEAGYSDNVLFNGASGGTSYSVNIAMQNILNHGMPSVAVFATGMNDGSDGDTPSTLWTNQRDIFINLCEQYGITPVFCTVPTVPTVNNEQKNAWVRSSGYRYIDFAKAVGANANGVWNTGMLSDDGVHPTALGAKALYTQVLSDLPEVFANK